MAAGNYETSISNRENVNTNSQGKTILHLPKNHPKNPKLELLLTKKLLVKPFLRVMTRCGRKGLTGPNNGKKRKPSDLPGNVQETHAAARKQVRLPKNPQEKDGN